MDWYNLEKSKRIKSFWCGEFDACIEMAEAGNCSPIKKREKYAHQEDAILHALELEEKQLDTNQQSTAISFHANKKALGVSDGGSNQHSSEVYVLGKPGNQEFQKSSRKTPSSLVEKYYQDHPLSVIRNRKVKPCVEEIRKHEIATHLRLEDRSPQIGITHDYSDLLPHSGDSLEFINQVESGNTFSARKRKTVQSVMINDSPAEILDRCQLHAKVFQTGEKFSASCSFQPQLNGTVNQVLGVEYQIDISHNAQKNTSMHPLPDVDEPLDYSRRTYRHSLPEAENSDRHGKPGFTSTESTQSGWSEENVFYSSATDSELDMGEEKFRSGFADPFKQTAESSIESGMPQWHLKGKHDGQILAKKFQDFVDGKNFGGKYRSNVPLWETFSDCKGTIHNVGEVEAAKVDTHGPEFIFERKLDYDDKEDEQFTGLGNKGDGEQFTGLGNKGDGEQFTGLGNTGDGEQFTGLGNKGDDDLESQTSDLVHSDDYSQLVTQSSWGPVGTLCMFWRSHWEEPEGNVDQLYTSHFSSIVMPMLVDVDLKVQARCQGARAPLISLISKLDGKAIIGHAVQVEILEDGSTDLLVPTNKATSDGNRASPLIWRTAKRTCMHRLPRSKPDLSNYMCKKKAYFDPLKPQVKKRIYHAHQLASDKFQRKHYKTRTVSSFTSEIKINSESGLLGLGLIKLDNSMPRVSCVPVKVVFSRILESVGKPSLAVAHWTVAARTSEGNPL